MNFLAEQALRRIYAVREVLYWTRAGRPAMARKWCAEVNATLGAGTRVRTARGEVVVEAPVGARVPHVLSHAADVLVLRKPRARG